MNDPLQMAEEQRAEMFREFHSQHLKRQTKAVESIKNYVAIWFWLSVAGAVLLFLSAVAGQGF